MTLKGGGTLDLFGQSSAALVPAPGERREEPRGRGAEASPSSRGRGAGPSPSSRGRGAGGLSSSSRGRRAQASACADPVSQHIELDGVVLELVHKKVKHLRLSVHPPIGDVRVSAPLRMRAETIRSFVTSKLDWIRRQQQRLQAREFCAPYAYVDHEIHFVWGQQYPLVVLERNAAPLVELKDATLLLHVRPGSSARKRQEILTDWHRSIVETSARPLVATWEPLMRVTVARVSARHMRTRWGSCTPGSRQIRLSTELAKKPRECLEYVVVHEMVHLLEASHNRRFARLMNQFMPEWRVRRLELNLPRHVGC